MNYKISKKGITIAALIILFFAIISLFSCQSNKTKAKSIHTVYLKSKKTGLCFSAIDFETGTGFEYNSLTCVPCDSLKNVEVIEIE
jgi:uncharacterized protein YpmB